MDDGFVKLWRKTKESRVFRNEGLFKVWMWCLMKASHKKRWWTMKTGKSEIEIELLPGQFVFGRLSAAKELNMKPSTVRNRMAKLEKMLNLDIKEDSQYSIISIINWDTYQPKEKKKDSKEDNQRTGKGQSKDTDKNVNTLKNEENKEPPLPPKGKSVSKKQQFKNYLKTKIENTSFFVYEKELCEFIDYRMSMTGKKKYQTEKGIDGLLTCVGDLVRAKMDPMICLPKCMEEEWLKPKPEYFDSPNGLNGSGIDADKAYFKKMGYEYEDK